MMAKWVSMSSLVKNIISPFVTVYIPTYNRCFLLERAVESLLNQTYANFEVIIVDDCSIDDTLDYLAQVSQKDSRVRYFQNEKNSGACLSRNKAIMEAKGEFITGLDDDDEFESERLQFLVDNFDPKYAFISTAIKIIDKNGLKKGFCGDMVFSHNDLIYDNVAGNQFFTFTDRLKSIGGFDLSFKSAQDLDVMVRLCINYGVAKRFNPLLYRMYINHDLPRITASSGKISGLVTFLEKHSHHMSKKQRLYHSLLISYWKHKPNKSLHLVVFMLFLNPKKFFRSLKRVIFC